MSDVNVRCVLAVIPASSRKRLPMTVSPLGDEWSLTQSSVWLEFDSVLPNCWSCSKAGIELGRGRRGSRLTRNLNPGFCSAPESPVLFFMCSVDELQVSFQVHFPGASPKDEIVACRNGPSGDSLHITNGGEKICFSSCNFWYSVSTGKWKTLCGFFHSLLKSVGNSCYFGRLQGNFLAAALGEFYSNPKNSPFLLQRQHLPVTPSFFFPWFLLHSLLYYPIKIS